MSSNILHLLEAASLGSLVCGKVHATASVGWVCSLSYSSLSTLTTKELRRALSYSPWCLETLAGFNKPGAVFPGRSFTSSLSGLGKTSLALPFSLSLGCFSILGAADQDRGELWHRWVLLLQTHHSWRCSCGRQTPF